MKKAEENTTKIGVGSILSWGLGGLLVVGGITELFTKLVMGIFTLLAGLVIFPPAVKFIKNKTHFELSKTLKIIAFLVLLGIGGALSGTSNTPTTSLSNTTNQQDKPSAAPSVRQVKGITVTLGAGTFTGGKDVVAGLYDVTAPGQSGNFIVSGADSYNDIFGQGITKIRAQISEGDEIQLSGLSSVTFTPVTTPFITTHTTASLYAGTFVVGQDIGSGRYVATTTVGSSGNFIVHGNNSVNEILGQNGFGGVPSVTTNLSDGDIITISGLNQVIMTPQ